MTVLFFVHSMKKILWIYCVYGNKEECHSLNKKRSVFVMYYSAGTYEAFARPEKPEGG